LLALESGAERVEVTWLKERVERSMRGAASPALPYHLIGARLRPILLATSENPQNANFALHDFCDFAITEFSEVCCPI
jgi:hypothetical protein